MNTHGEFIQGESLVQHKQAIIQRLTELDMILIGCNKQKVYRSDDWQTAQKCTFMRQLATLLKTGVTLSDSLRLLSEGQSHRGWRALLSDIHQQIAGGKPFSTVLKSWPAIFPPLYPTIMQIGEITGQLDECCFRLARQQERQHQLQKKVRNALRYPLFIALTAITVTSGMLLFVLPEFVSIYQTFQTPLPFFTRLVITLSTWLKTLFWPVFISSLSLIAVWQNKRKTSLRWQRYEQQIRLHLPLISRLYRGNQLSHIFSTLALTQRAGLTLQQSLNAVAETLTDTLWQEGVIRLRERIAEGVPLHQALNGQPLFTSLCHQLVKTGEATGALDVLLEQLAQWHESNTYELTETLTATLEPLIMVMMGGIIGTLVIAIYLPIFSLGDILR